MRRESYKKKTKGSEETKGSIMETEVQRSKDLDIEGKARNEVTPRIIKGICIGLMGTSLRLKERVAVITFYPNYHKPLESKGNKELLLTIKYRLKKEMKVP